MTCKIQNMYQLVTAKYFILDLKDLKKVHISDSYRTLQNFL